MHPVIGATVLLKSYPTPFNPETLSPYELEREDEVRIQIYNPNGQLVRQLEIGLQSRGRYINRQKAAYWDGKTEQGEKVASGIYFYQLQAGAYTAIKKMVILKWSITQKFVFGISTVLVITNLCVLVACPEQSLAENRTSLFKISNGFRGYC